MSIEQIAERMNSHNRQARRLYEEARTHLETCLYSTAAHLAILSIEQGRQSQCLRRLVGVKDQEQIRNIWNGRRILSGVVFMVSTTDVPLIDGALPPVQHIRTLAQIKQDIESSEHLQHAPFPHRTTRITPSLARQMVTVADALSKPHRVTPLELRLWQEHVVDACNSVHPQKGFHRWLEAMLDEGLRAP